MFNFTHQDRFNPDQEQSTGNVHWKVPRKTNNLFTGRAKLLERIKDAIRKYAPEEKIFVITGLGGLGKSEVCLKIANEMRQEYATPSLLQLRKLIVSGSGECFGSTLVPRTSQKPASPLSGECLEKK